MGCKTGKIFWITIIFLFLSAAPCRADWMFVVLGDTREDTRRAQIFSEIIKEINQNAPKSRENDMKPEFLLHLGDFESRRGDRESMERFKERMKSLKIRCYPTKGNYEVAEQKGSFFSLPPFQQILKNNQDFTREYKALFDLKESYYSFDHRDLHAIVLDNSLGTFHVKGTDDIIPEQLAWLEKDLEETARKVETGSIRHTIVCAHIPVPSPSPEITTHDMLEYVSRHYAEGKPLAEADARYFWDILEKYREKSRINRLFFGHDRRYVSYQQKGFPVTITGGGGAPLIAEEKGGFYHYVIIKVTEQDLKERIIKVHPPRKTPAQ